MIMSLMWQFRFFSEALIGRSWSIANGVKGVRFLAELVSTNETNPYTNGPSSYAYTFPRGQYTSS